MVPQATKTFYTPGKTCTWQISRETLDFPVNIVVDASEMGPGARVFVSEQPMQNGRRECLLAQYGGFSQSLRQDAVSTASIVYVQFVADNDAPPAAGPVIFARLVKQSKNKASPRTVGKIIYIGAGLLIVAYGVGALVAWRQYTHIAARRLAEEQQAAR
jgi:hypothetical protein